MAVALALILSVFAAVIPTLAYSIAFYWADRYEREPRSLLLVAFVWGAIPAVIVSLIGEIALGSPFVKDAESLEAALVEGVVVAPVIEEVAKAAALLGLYSWRRSEFDGVLDGLVYGALIGFGFAMTENFLYFVGAYDEGGLGSLTLVIVIRAIIFGLNHAFYTGLTGIGFGLARSSRNRFVGFLFVTCGLAAAITIHALHNLGVTIADVTPLGFLLSLSVAGGGLGLVLVAVFLAWNQERSIIRLELAEELGNTISTQELITLTGRWRQPLRRRQGDGADRMALYVELAFRKRRLRTDAEPRKDEILSEIERIRIELANIDAGPDTESAPMSVDAG